VSTDTKISRYVKGFFLLILVGGALFMVVQPFPCVAAESLAQIASDCVVVNEKFWRSCARPPETLSSRTLLAYALALCEARQHPERLDRLFELAGEMQDRSGFGLERVYPTTSNSGPGWPNSQVLERTWMVNSIK
jgi:hypothetical protein